MAIGIGIGLPFRRRRAGAGGPAAITGSGVLQAATAVVSGAGTVAIAGTGALLSSSALVSGQGGLGISGSGQLQVQVALLAAAGIVTISGSGALESQAAQIVGVEEGSGVPAIVYDGSQSHLVETGGFTGAVDGPAISYVEYWEPAIDGAAMVLAFGSGAVPWVVLRNADNTYSFIGGTAGAVFSVVTAAVLAAAGKVLVVATANGTDASLTVTHSGGTETGVNTAGSAADLTQTGDNYFGSRDGSTEMQQGTVHLKWLDNTYIGAANDVEVIEQFLETLTHTLRDPGADGSNPLDGDHAPLACFKNPFSTHTTNSGTGGNVMGGTFAPGTSPGPYAEDYVGTTLVDAVEVTTPPASGAGCLTWGNPGPSGSADSDKHSIVVWYKLLSLPSTDGADAAVYAANASSTQDHLQLAIESSDNKWNFRSLAIGTTSLVSNVVETVDGNWHCLMASFDADLANAGASAVAYMYRDGVSVLAGGNTFPTLNPDTTRPTAILGRNSNAPHPFPHQVALVWFNHGVALDFSNSAVRAKFYDAGKFVAVGATGELPTGSAPRICHQGDATAFPSNVGAGNDPINNVGVGLTTVAGPVAA